MSATIDQIPTWSAPGNRAMASVVAAKPPSAPRVACLRPLVSARCPNRAAPMGRVTSTAANTNAVSTPDVVLLSPAGWKYTPTEASTMTGR